MRCLIFDTPFELDIFDLGIFNCPPWKIIYPGYRPIEGNTCLVHFPTKKHKYFHKDCYLLLVYGHCQSIIPKTGRKEYQKGTRRNPKKGRKEYQKGEGQDGDPKKGQEAIPNRAR